MFITFSYRKDERPDTYKEMLKQKDKLDQRSKETI